MSEGLFLTFFGVGKLGLSRDYGGLNCSALPREGGITEVALLELMNIGGPYLTFGSSIFSEGSSSSFAERIDRFGSDLVNSFA